MIFNWFGKYNAEANARFDRWLNSGAQQAHKKLFDALSGKPPSNRDKVSIVHLGNLSLTTGRIIVGDPVYAQEKGYSDFGSKDGCFDEDVTPGDHPVDILLLNSEIAALRITFKVAPAHALHLEPAFTDISRAIAKQQRVLPSVGVDSATAALFSSESLATFRANPEYLQGFDYYKLGKDCPWAECRFPDGSNAFVGLAGKGDGSYPAYFAKTSQRDIVALIVDFRELGKPQKLDF